MDKLINAGYMVLDILDIILATIKKMNITDRRLLCLYDDLESRVTELEKK